MSTETIVSSPSRRLFLQSAGATGLAVGAGALLAGCGGGGNNGGSSSSGAHISSAAIKTAFLGIQADENNHVTLLQAAITALGGTPRPKPSFYTPILTAPQSSLATFVSLADTLGNTEPGAYLAAVGLAALDSDYQDTVLTVNGVPYTPLAAAVSISLVEGRHVGFFNAITGRPLLTNPNSAGDSQQPTNNSREVIIMPDQVYARASPFVGNIGNGDGYNTDLNGGPALPTDGTVANATLIDIFNYALFLEFVGSTFYNLNVPHFFGS